MLNWAVIGAGRFGAIHAEVLAQLPDVKLRAVCSRTPARGAALAERLGVSFTTDAAELLADPSLDVVSIVTHWREHFELARAALQHGKHVLLEKPMAATADECQELVTCAATSSQYLLVGHVCRFDPRMVLARDAIRSGRLGKIVALHARRNLPVAPGSVRLDKISPLMGDGIHDADLMMWFLGRAPTRVSGHTLRVHNYQYPDAGWAVLEFGSDALGVVETVWCLPPSAPTAIDAELRVIGTAGQLTIDCAHTGLVIQDAEGRRQPDTSYWPLVHGHRAGALLAEIKYLADCIRQQTPPAVITPAEAARAVLVMETAERSARDRAPAVVPTHYPFLGACAPQDS
jgi:UDP-N-acetylglucosamine 3-dehydrogenase